MRSFMYFSQKYIAGTALGFQIDGAADFFCALNPCQITSFYTHGFVKMVDAISLEIDGEFAPCASL